MIGDATVSACGRYRYRLTRTWDAWSGLLTFVMFNPSTADALEDDNTIRRCLGYARDLGYGGIEVVNLYAWRATKPADLWAARASADIVGPENNAVLAEVLHKARQTDSLVIAAWGAHVRRDPQRVAEVCRMPNADRLHALAVTADGIPRHPLMLPLTARPEPWAVS